MSDPTTSHTGNRTRADYPQRSTILTTRTYGIKRCHLMSDPTTMIGKVGFEPTSSLSSFTQFHMNPKTLLRPSLKVANLLSQPVWIVIIMFPRGLLSLPSAIKGLALDHSATYPLVMWCHLTSDPTTKPSASFDLATLGLKVRCSSDWAKKAINKII